MKHRPLPPQEYLHARFNYDPLTGALTWKRKPGNTRADNIFNSRYSGTPVGCIDHHNRRVTNLDHKTYQVHRLIWTHMTGEDPAHFEVDHIDNDPSNNTFANLRLADRSHNQANTKARSNTGIKGITYHVRTGNYVLWYYDEKLTYRSKTFRLIETATEFQSANCHRAARFGEFARH